jgi:hypothetical protein
MGSRGREGTIVSLGLAISAEAGKHSGGQLVLCPAQVRVISVSPGFVTAAEVEGRSVFGMQQVVAPPCPSFLCPRIAVPFSRHSQSRDQ